MSDAEPTTFRVEVGDFAPWMVGRDITISSGPNAGTYAIASVVNSFTVTLTGAAFDTDTDVTWELLPSFPTAGGLTARILRATVAGDIITTPVAMPNPTMLVDYTTIESAQVLSSPSTLATATQSPFYLADEGALIKDVLDLITAAGVEPTIVLTT